MGRACRRYFASSGLFTNPVLGACPKGGIMTDFLFVLLTIGVFSVLWLILKGIEHFEH
jgi:hypothetical protein